MKTAVDTIKVACTLSLLATSACSAEPGPETLGGGGAGSSAVAGAGVGGVNAGGSGGSAGGSGGAGGAGAGTGGSGGAAPGSPTFVQVAKILEDNCGSKCHSADVQDKIVLTSADAAGLYTRLTTPLSTDLCYEVLPIQKGYASISLLSTVIRGGIDKPCTLPRMPYGCETTSSCLSEADIATIDGWINAGAFQN